MVASATRPVVHGDAVFSLPMPTDPNITVQGGRWNIGERIDVTATRPPAGLTFSPQAPGGNDRPAPAPLDSDVDPATGSVTLPSRALILPPMLVQGEVTQDE